MKLDKARFEQLHKSISKILIFFSLVLISSYLTIDTYFFSNQFKGMALNNAVTNINKQEKSLQNFLNNSEIEILSINESTLFENYLVDELDKEIIEEMFLNIAKTNENIMQVRYIDKNGIEKIRIDRKLKDDLPFIVDDNKLQDKSNRYYFYSSKEKKKYKVWFSNLDLNIENGQVQIPFQSTIRAVLPLTKNSKFDGILIINYFMNNYFDTILKDSMYEYVIADEEGYTLIHNTKSKSWGKYQNPQVKLSSLSLEYLGLEEKDFYSNSNFVYKKLDTPISNELFLILRLNKSYLDQQKFNEVVNKFFISIAILFLSVVLIMIISKKVRIHILEVTDYDKHISLIDDNIILTTMGLDGRITYVSKAFCEISKYSEKELIGTRKNITDNMNVDKSNYKKLWRKIIEDECWEGELKNKTKFGDSYWVKTKICPTMNKNNEKIGYTLIMQDITDKKIIEKLSIHDGLTNLYNRKYFDDILPKVLNQAKRKEELIAFMMLDVDYFKQYNDTYGHQNGDKVLKAIAKVLKESLKRSNDYIFRIGGEEFAIVFSPKSNEDTNLVAKKIKTSIENLNIEHSTSQVSKYVTASIGLYVAESKKIKTYGELYKNADTLLYNAKKQGRNRVCDK